jgi:hypothetical protein
MELLRELCQNQTQPVILNRSPMAESTTKTKMSTTTTTTTTTTATNADRNTADVGSSSLSLDVSSYLPNHRSNNSSTHSLEPPLEESQQQLECIETPEIIIKLFGILKRKCPPVFKLFGY